MACCADGNGVCCKAKAQAITSVPQDVQCTIMSPSNRMIKLWRLYELGGLKTGDWIAAGALESYSDMNPLLKTRATNGIGIAW